MSRDGDRRDERRDEEVVVSLEARDAELSALLDGELDPAAEAALRERIASDDALAARFAALGEADGQLRALAGELPEDARLARLRAGLQDRIDAADSADGDAPLRSGSVVPLRRPTRWMAPVAAALAAGLALYLLTGSGPPLTGSAPVESPVPQRDLADRTITDAPPPTADPGAAIAPAEEPAADPAASRLAAAEPDPAASPASSAGPRDAAGAAPEPTALAAASTPAPSAETAAEPIALEDPVLDAATEEELAVALQYDLLADLDVIENLELLELLQEQRRMEQL